MLYEAKLTAKEEALLAGLTSARLKVTFCVGQADDP